jgi:hypothetical protein
MIEMSCEVDKSPFLPMFDAAHNALRLCVFLFYEMGGVGQDYNHT